MTSAQGQPLGLAPTLVMTRVTSGSADLEWRGALLCTLTYSLCVIHTEVEAQCISDVSDVSDVPDVPDVPDV